MITSAYIKMGEYTHSLVVCTDDGWSVHTTIHFTGVKLPPIDPSSLKGRQTLWVLAKIAGQETGEFPRA